MNRRNQEKEAYSRLGGEEYRGLIGQRVQIMARDGDNTDHMDTEDEQSDRSMVSMRHEDMIDLRPLNAALEARMIEEERAARTGIPVNHDMNRDEGRIHRNILLLDGRLERAKVMTRKPFT